MYLDEEKETWKEPELIFILFFLSESDIACIILMFLYRDVTHR